jgi:hypothetical protein
VRELGDAGHRGVILVRNRPATPTVTSRYLPGVRPMVCA